MKQNPVLFEKDKQYAARNKIATDLNTKQTSNIAKIYNRYFKIDNKYCKNCQQIFQNRPQIMQKWTTNVTKYTTNKLHAMIIIFLFSGGQRSLQLLSQVVMMMIRMFCTKIVLEH